MVWSGSYIGGENTIKGITMSLDTLGICNVEIQVLY